MRPPIGHPARSNPPSGCAARLGVDRRAVAFCGTVLLGGVLWPAFSTSADSTVTMRFGRPEVGSGCNFPCDDDHSFHAVDRIAPKSVAISAGDTVEFDVDGFHQVAVYEPGIRPRDIEPNPATFPFVEDPGGRLAIGVPTVDFAYTFDEPGKYLVICSITPHFEEAQMWAWVIVR